MNNGKICVSVCAETADEMIAKINQAEEFADLIEVRFDCVERSEIANLRYQLSDLERRVPLLATFRADDQGGHGNKTFADRKEFWRSVQREFWGVDLEEDVFDTSEGWDNRIISQHDFDGVPSDLTSIYERLSASDAEIVKLAVTADDITDGISVWKLLEQAKVEKKQIIPIAMGDAGKWTRILGLAYGAFLTYASLGTGGETAPGQVTAKDLVEVYRAKELDEDTQVFGVLGEPIAQSMSPYMHNPAFAERGLNAVFVSFLVKNIDEFVRRMVKPESREVEFNFGGFSVTMPHKQSIIKHLDTLDATAKAIGAVNTVKITDGKLTGYNTDAHGFITPLKAKFGEVRDTRIAVFGAGGAARACVYALKEEGAEVTVFARDKQKGRAFADEFDVGFIEFPNESKETKGSLSDFDILVDTTPLGMKGDRENDSLFNADQLDGLKFVYDLVTKASDTPILREAHSIGIPTLGGLEMLIAQGAKQFEIWTGTPAPVELMRNSLVARMPE